jgi:hypothetical protein
MTSTARRLKGVFALMLALVLALGTFTVALADGEAIVGTDSNDPAQATITKELQIPAGTTFPTGGFEFTFEFEAKAYNGSDETDDLAKVPAITALKVEYNGTETGVPENATPPTYYTFSKDTSSIFDDVDFPTSGVYTYTVTETDGTTTLTDDDHENLYYSLAEYEITAYVKEDENNNNELYVAAIVTKIIKDDAGDEVSGTPKVDPGEEANDEGLFTAMTFTNAYWVVKGGDDPDDPDPEDKDNWTLGVSLDVEGDFASTTAYFPFKITVSAPSILPGASALTYNAYVVDADGNVVTPDANSNGAPDNSDNYGSYFTFAYNTVKEISLKHGEILVFVDTPVGTTYTAEIQGAAGYTPEVVVTTNNVAAQAITGTSGAALSTGLQLVGETYPNLAAFTDSTGTETPTGIIINNLPYLGLILLAVASLGAYVAVKSRRRA